MTENLLLETNLEDLVHGLVMGDSVLEPGTRDNERIWRSAMLFVSQPLQSCLSDNLYYHVWHTISQKEMCAVHDSLCNMLLFDWFIL